MSKSELIALLRQYAQRYGIDEEIAIRQIQQESGFSNHSHRLEIPNRPTTAMVRTLSNGRDLGSIAVP